MWFFIFLLFPIFLLYGEDKDLIPKSPPQIKLQERQESFPISTGPVLVGPLLSPSGQTLPAGHIDFEPYLIVSQNIGFYNNQWHLERFEDPFETINILLLTLVGLNPIMDFMIIPQFFYQSICEMSYFGFGDLFWQVSFQLIKEEDEKNIPGLRFFFGQFVPTGEFDLLNPSRLGTDALGGGSFDTIIGLVTSYIWAFQSPHYLASRASVGFQTSSPVSLKGLSVYGGETGTHGIYYPGNFIQILIGLEYTLTRYWALALDIDFDIVFPSQFEGISKVPLGTNEMSYQLSFAPAIEFNHSQHIGVIAGVWFTALGRNASSFVSGILAINFYL